MNNYFDPKSEEMVENERYQRGDLIYSIFCSKLNCKSSWANNRRLKLKQFLKEGNRFNDERDLVNIIASLKALKDNHSNMSNRIAGVEHNLNPGKYFIITINYGLKRSKVTSKYNLCLSKLISKLIVKYRQ